MRMFVVILAALLVLAPACFAGEVPTFMGVGIGRQPSGEPFNIGWAGSGKYWGDGLDTRLLVTINYGQFVAQNIDALGASLVLGSRWWKYDGANKPIIGDLWLNLDVGFMDKFRQTEEGDRAIAFKVAPFLSAQVTKVFSVQAGYCGFNSGTGMRFDSFWWGGLTASTNLVFGGK